MGGLHKFFLSFTSILKFLDTEYDWWLIHIRVKSLSKGSNSRKDISSSTSNLRNSIALPVSSSTLMRSEDVKFEKLPYETNRFGLPVTSSILARSEDVKFEKLSFETNRFGWPKQTDKNPIGRSTIYTPPTENYTTDYGNTDEEIMEDDFDYSMEVNDPINISRMEKTETQIKPIVEANDDLIALLEVFFDFFSILLEVR